MTGHLILICAILFPNDCRVTVSQGHVIIVYELVGGGEVELGAGGATRTVRQVTYLSSLTSGKQLNLNCFNRTKECNGR